METTIATNTITSQYGIEEGAEFISGTVMGVTEASHDGNVDATLLNQGEDNTTTLNLDYSLNNGLNIFL